MKTILVDDMLLDLQLFELKCADMPDFEIVGRFTEPAQAVAYAETHEVDFALLDIDMPGMDGIELAKRLRQLRRDIIIVFATAHTKFAVEALRMKADYMIFKPFDREDIADVMERAKLLHGRQRKRIYFHTFGVFDMLVAGQSVHFHSAKAKELMALCVFRDGRPVSIHEIVEYLWGEDAEVDAAKAANKNVTSLLPNAQQIGWIAGSLAGLMTQSNTIAFIGGMELDTTLGKYKGYTEAAQFVGKAEGKDIKVLDPVYAGSFSATDKGIEFAKAMIDQGADVFFGDASAVDSGARQAIDEANKAAGSVKIYDIGQPSDLLGQNECVICSQVTDNSSLVALSMDAVEKGTFGGEVIYGTLQNGVLSAGKMNDLIPADVQTKYLDYIDQMTKDTFMK